MEPPFVSILLPVRGEQEDLIACLDSLAAQTYPGDRFEVLIADGSDEPITLAIVPSGLDVRIVPNPERLMSRGLNLVAREARGERLAIVSAHSWLPPEYLERMAATARETGAANVGTRIRKVARSPWGRAIAAATSSPLGVGGSVQHHGSEPGPTDSAFPGFIDRAAFEAVGGFNPDLACNEDDEFNARLRAAGHVIWYEPAVEVAYRPRETLDGAVRQHFRYGRWKVAVARTGVPGYLRLRHMVPALALAAAVLLPIGALWRRVLAVPLAVAAMAYSLLAGSEARRLGPLHGVAAWRVAAAFPFIHAGYGLGFLRGLLDRGMPDEGRSGGTGSAGTVPATPGGGEPVYRAMTVSDAPGAARLHQEVFGDYFLGHMGQGFLEIFYREFVGKPGNCGVVALVDGAVAGAVVGSSDLARFFADLYRGHFLELGGRFAVRLVRDGYVRRHTAARVPHLVKAVESRLGLRRSTAPDPDAWPPAQLLSIGVAASYRGRGIAEELTERFCRQLADDGIDAVGLSVLNDNARAIAFYEKSGWVRHRVDAASTTFWRPLRAGAEEPPGGRTGPV